MSKNTVDIITDEVATIRYLEGTLEEYVDTGIDEIGTNAFRGLKIKNIECPNVSVIGPAAFNSCLFIEKATFSQVTEIENTAFESCVSLKEFDGPMVSGDINQYAFNNCVNLSNLIVGQSVRDVGAYAFESCYALPSFSHTVRDLVGSAFYRCYDISSVDIFVTDSRQSYLKPNVFFDCYSLESVKLQGIKRATYSSTFSGCYNLKRLVLPDIVSISANVFSGCYNLTTIMIGENCSGVCTLGTTSFYNSQINIYVPDSLVESYQSATNWAIYSSRIKGIQSFDEGDQSAPEYVVYNSGVYSKNLSITGAVCNYFPNNAFRSCSNLQYVSASTCMSISYNTVFDGCFNLKTAYFPQCSIFAYNQFSRCYNLRTVIAPLLSRIRDVTFQQCSNLKSVSFLSCSIIDHNAFESCVRLQSAIFPSCGTIGYQAFKDCTQLSTVYFPVCSSMGFNVFSSCVRLTTAIVGTDLSYICSCAASPFIYCPNATIYVPDSLAESYRVATNWAGHSSQIKGISELPASIAEELGISTTAEP